MRASRLVAGIPDQVPPIDLELARAFLVVADELHLSRAAERLFVAQSTLSGQMRRLQDGLGVELLDRSGTSIELTPRGALFAVEARALLARADAAMARLRDADPPAPQ